MARALHHANVRFRHGWDDIGKELHALVRRIGLLRQTQNFRGDAA